MTTADEARSKPSLPHPPPFDLLITNASLLADPATPQFVPGSFLAVTNGIITALGPMAALPAESQSRQTIDAAGGLLMPGLINCHSHAAMTLFRGLADDLPLMTWLMEHIFPAEAAWVEPEMVYWCSRLAAAEMLLSGTTCLADGYFHEDAAAQAFIDVGIRAVAAQGIIDFPAPGVTDPGQNIVAAANFLEQWRQASPLLTPALFCHSPYTCSPETIQKAKALAREHHALFFIHLAETASEGQQVHEAHGRTPTRLLHDLGVLDEQTVCVHGVWLDQQDIALLRQSGSKMVTCVESNMKLASGVAPLSALIAAGVPVGLGTDGCASNNDQDLFQEMSSCVRLHRLAGAAADLLPVSQLLDMATCGGATVLGMERLVGRLSVGMQADCILVDVQRLRLPPCHNVEPLVYGGHGGDVRTVVVAGRVVVEERRLLSVDLAESMTEVRKMAARVARARQLP